MLKVVSRKEIFAEIFLFNSSDGGAIFKMHFIFSLVFEDESFLCRDWELGKATLCGCRFFGFHINCVFSIPERNLMWG